MPSIADNIAHIRATLPQGVDLVAVSKYHPVEAVAQAYAAGQRAFGESRAAELTVKAAALPADIEWHFIGHLQTNKVRPVVAAASLIHSIDSERLLRAVDSEAARQSRRIRVLLQAHVAAEETKFGLTPDQLLQLDTTGLQAVTIAGLMGMASNTDDEARILADFQALRDLFNRLRTGSQAANPSFVTLSMGMSHDYSLALSCGSNMVRIGSAIFSEI